MYTARNRLTTNNSTKHIVDKLKLSISIFALHTGLERQACQQLTLFHIDQQVIENLR